IRHHLIDCAEPTEPFSAARWAALADAAALAISERKKVVFVVGGSGLYLHAWLHGLVATPPPDPAIRKRHRETPIDELHTLLCQVDPDCGNKILPTDFVRISRALEVYEQTGRSMSQLRKEQAREPRYRALLLGVAPPREVLAESIDARVDGMIRMG